MKDSDFRDLYPFASHTIEIDGHRYHYLDEGSGPVILMLHGNPTWSFYYRDLVCGLRSDFRVIVPDHMGCGLSDKPQDYPYRLETHIGNVRTLLERLDVTRMSLAVHDWGGPIGLGYAVQNAERIDRILLFNTTTFMTRHYPFRILACRLPIVGNLAVRGCNLFAVGAVYLACKNRRKMTPAVKAAYLKPYDSYANRIANLRFVQDIPLTRRHPTWTLGAAMQEQMSRLTRVPMLICWGMLDFCFTEYFLDRIRQQFPQAIVHMFSNAGHYVVEDAIDEILPLARTFMSDKAGGGD